MPYITNKERAKRVRLSNQSYFVRKLLIALTVGSLVVLVVFSIIAVVTMCQFFGNKLAHVTDDYTALMIVTDLCARPFSLIAKNGGDDGSFTLSGFGWFMAIWSVITLGLSVVSLVLVLTMKSPKQAKKNINVLQGAAISGKKLEAHANATQVYRERGTSPKKLKKQSQK